MSNENEDDRIATLEAQLAAAKAENERLKAECKEQEECGGRWHQRAEEAWEWLAEIHELVARGKHKDVKMNYTCAVSAILDIKQDAHETREELSALTAEAERLRGLLEKLSAYHGGCIVDPPCGGCVVCDVRSALAAPTVGQGKEGE